MSTTLSSLELMLVQIQQIEDQPKDAPPALPVRPVSRARLPRARKNLPFNLYKSGCEENCGYKIESFKFLESIHEPDLADSDGIRVR